jgi:hypothetical protein
MHATVAILTQRAGAAHKWICGGCDKLYRGLVAVRSRMDFHATRCILQGFVPKLIFHDNSISTKVRRL